MRSVFIKIFLWFWLTHLLVAGAFFFTMGREAPDRQHDKRRNMIGQAIAGFGHQAVERRLRDGAASLKEYVEELDRTTGTALLLVDPDGEELLGRPVPREATELIPQARESGEAEFMPPQGGFRPPPPSPDHGPMIARRVVGSDARQYVAVAKLSPGPMMPRLSTPERQIPRLAAIVAMGAVLCYLLTKYLTAPVRKMGDAARRLAGGNLAVRMGTIVGHHRDEIGDLGRDFDFMAERIESLVSAQRRLIRDMSHELRSPLARLNVALALAAQRAGPEAESALDRIEREVQRLNELIGELLTLARLEGGDTAIQKETIDLPALLREIVDDADFEARSRNRYVTLTPCESYVATGTTNLLRSAIENVIRNAIRYTAEGTQVEVTMTGEAASEGSQAVIRVRDHGPGVPEESLQDIFRAFHRVGDDRDRQTGGVGLGLAIAREAIRLHGGTTTAFNEPTGGLRIEIRLPAMPSPA